jgi:hypothetical protein
VNPAVFAYSTIDKRPGAPDANRDADEDLWLTWVVSDSDPSLNPVWQLTADEMGTTGDNFGPRWSPSGTQLAFIHTTPGGAYEIWRLPVTIPTGAADAPVVGTPELVAAGRDAAWASETKLVYTQDAKLYAVDVAAPGPRGGAPVQLTFDPPPYAASDQFVDRHPDFTADGQGVFDAIGRENVASVYLQAYEVDNSIAPPETLETNAWIFYRPPGGVGAYPIFEGADTLRTPTLLRSLPVGGGGDFDIGVRLDRIFLADTTRETYCDTTLIETVDLQPGDSDTLRYYFEIARGTLRVRTMLSNTTVAWTRRDGLEAGGGLIANAGDAKLWACLLSYPVVDGVPNPGPDGPDGYGVLREDYLVTGTRVGSPPYEVMVTISPGDTANVVLYPPEPSADPARLELPSSTALVSSVTARSLRPDVPAQALEALRAPGDVAASVWRVEVEDDAAKLTELLTSTRALQNPAISPEMGGVRYLAYVASEADRWTLFVQRVAVDHPAAGERWRPDGSPVAIATPGSSDNYSCTRSVFYPRFLPGSTPGNLRVLVAMSSCPDNEFEDLGFDDDPWAIGEIKIWQVSVQL